jgi:hypothetical protein
MELCVSHFKGMRWIVYMSLHFSLFLYNFNQNLNVVTNFNKLLNVQFYENSFFDFELLRADRRTGGRHKDMRKGTDEFFSICSMRAHQQFYYITILTYLVQILRNTSPNRPLSCNIIAVCIKILKLHSIILIDKYHRNQSFNLNGSHFSCHQSNEFLQELNMCWKAVFDS